MAYYRNMVAGASLIGQAEAAHLLRKNLDQEEEMARTIEQSAPRLLREAVQTA